MQSLCRFSLRWHQQFGRSANFAGHQKCMQILSRDYRQVAKRSPPRPAKRSPSPLSTELEHLDEISRQPTSDLVVHEYNQYGGDNVALEEVNPKDDLNKEIVTVRAQMEKLERELQAMRQGPFGPETEFMKSLPADERESLLKALAEEGMLQGEEDLLTMAELDQMQDDAELEYSARKQLGVTLRIPRKDQAFVRHFNKALRDTQDSESNPQHSLALWTWYLRCQQQISNFSTIISDDVWQTLWRTQINLNGRPKHLVMLARDMLAVEQPLNADQWADYVRALHASGDTATAVQIWQEQKILLRSHMPAEESYWNLGVKLFAALGRPFKAQQMAFSAIYDSKADPRILIPVIAAWAKSQGPEAMVRAWACYLRLRKEMGTQMSPKAFEDISNAFLEADCADMALNVFKDMLLSQEQSTHDSQSVYRRAVKHLDDVMQNANSEERINSIGLSSLLILPRAFQNRFFFTSWIKKLIGNGRIDAAAMVVELMYERGVTPDAKPLNGIIGAWLRDGSASAQRKAETMAWVMIDAREDLVKNRPIISGENVFRKIVQPGDFGHARRAVFLRKRLPPATIETFSIMLLHYTRRSDFEHAERLTHAMTGPCQIKPNSFIMNHWLYADLRASKLQDVWNRYKDLRFEIAPDLETFAALWDTAKVQNSRSGPASAKDFPNPRQLFSEMSAWYRALSDRRLASAKLDFSSDLYEQIIRCFCLSTDLPGALVAMHGLAMFFELHPNENSIRLVCGLAARFLPQPAGGRQRGKARHKNVLAQVADIIETIEERKKLELLDTGAEPGQLSDSRSKLCQELRLPIMTEFICMFLKEKQRSVTDSYLNDIKVAAKTMDVDMSQVPLDLPTAD